MTCTNPGGNLDEARSTRIGAGECGITSTADPRVFGPDAWRTFHTFARHYPHNPLIETQHACRSFVEALPRMIPCAHCGLHLQEFMHFNSAHDGESMSQCMGASGESVCASPETACLSQTNLRSYFLRAHNNVNTMTNPCRDRFTLDETFDMYGTTHLCARNGVFGDTSLIRRR